MTDHRQHLDQVDRDQQRQKQHRLPFDPPREQARLERVGRMFNDEPRRTTGKRLFDEQAYREASRIAREASRRGAGDVPEVRRSVTVACRAHIFTPEKVNQHFGDPKK